MSGSVVGVIVNYRSWELVCRCLDSFRDFCGQWRVRFVVVDHSEVDEGASISARHPEVVVLRPGTNAGFAGGCNRGLAWALDQNPAPDFILLVNPDAFVESDCLVPLIAAFQSSPRLGMVGPAIVRPDHTLWNGGGRLNWWLGGTRRILSDAETRGRAWAPVDFLSGCVLLLRTEAVRQVGLMDERYFLYFEDTDYVQRFLEKGWAVGYAPDAMVIHQASSVVGEQSPGYVYYYARNRILFLRRWARLRYRLVYGLYNALVKIPGAVLVFGLGRGRFDLVWAYWSGCWDALRGLTGPRSSSGRDLRSHPRNGAGVS